MAKNLSRWTHWKRHWCFHRWCHYYTRPVMWPWKLMLVPSKSESYSYDNKKMEIPTDRRLEKVLNGCRTQTRYTKKGITSQYMVCTIITSISKRNQIHHRDVSRFSEVDPESHRKHTPSSAQPFATLIGWVQSSSESENQAISRSSALTVTYQRGRQHTTRSWPTIARNRGNRRLCHHTHLCERHYNGRRHTIG